MSSLYVRSDGVRPQARFTSTRQMLETAVEIRERAVAS